MNKSQWWGWVGKVYRKKIRPNIGLKLNTVKCLIADGLSFNRYRQWVMYGHIRDTSVKNILTLFVWNSTKITYKIHIQANGTERHAQITNSLSSPLPFLPLSFDFFQPHNPLPPPLLSSGNISDRWNRPSRVSERDREKLCVTNVSGHMIVMYRKWCALSCDLTAF